MSRTFVNTFDATWGVGEVSNVTTEPVVANMAYTENNGRAYASTMSSVLDFFAQSGALRTRSEAEIISLFSRALDEDTLLALKALFYTRDIRGGLGERRTFRVILKALAQANPELVRANMPLIAEYGRWDDLYVLFNTPLHRDAINLIRTQLHQDRFSEYPSLLGKWLKSENASSKETIMLARQTIQGLGISPREYRKMLVRLRNRLNVIERMTSDSQWDRIDYAKIPSKAMLKYRKAFSKHDHRRFEAYLDSVNRGEAKINTGALYPYDIVRDVMKYGRKAPEQKALQTLWDNLPDYLGEGRSSETLTVLDTSGSMSGLPIQIALSLGLYLAERMTGHFANRFITFSRHPQWQVITGYNLAEKIHNMRTADWGMNTDVKAVFSLILNTAIQSRLAPEEMPKRVLIISDMEFDSAEGRNHERVFDTIRRDYKNAGYDLPLLVFWNVAARHEQYPTTLAHDNVQLVSGASAAIFKSVLNTQCFSAYDLMLETLNTERYEAIRLP